MKKRKLPPKKAPPKKATASEAAEAKRKKKATPVEESDEEEKEKEKPKPPKQVPKKRKTVFTEELIGDYKGILARKRMASLNASAIVAATYEVERHLDKNLASDCSSFESYDELDTMPTTTTKSTPLKSELIHIKKEPKEPKESKETQRERERERERQRQRDRENELKDAKDAAAGKMSSSHHAIVEESNDSKYSKETKETNTDTTITTTGYRDSTTSTKDAKDCSRPTSSSVVIVQDTDVTITGVYVNASNGAAQEAYCKMQYRVQSSVTEERVLRPGSVEPPKSYTPLSALSSMLPPGASSGLSEGKLNA